MLINDAEVTGSQTAKLVSLDRCRGAMTSNTNLPLRDIPQQPAWRSTTPRATIYLQLQERNDPSAVGARTHVVMVSLVPTAKPGKSNAVESSLYVAHAIGPVRRVAGRWAHPQLNCCALLNKYLISSMHFKELTRICKRGRQAPLVCLTTTLGLHQQQVINLRLRPTALWHRDQPSGSRSVVETMVL